MSIANDWVAERNPRVRHDAQGRIARRLYGETCSFVQPNLGGQTMTIPQIHNASSIDIGKNALNETKEPICPITLDVIPKMMRAIFTYCNDRGETMAVTFHRNAIFKHLERSHRDPVTQNVIHSLLNHEGKVIYPVRIKSETAYDERFSSHVPKTKRRFSIFAPGYSEISSEELKERNKHRQMIDKMVLEKFKLP